MKNLFNRTISIICAVTLLICALSVCAFAEEETATPTDLQEENLTEEQPQDISEGLEKEQESEPEPEQENTENQEQEEPEQEEEPVQEEEPEQAEAPEQENEPEAGEESEKEPEKEPEEEQGEETPDESSDAPVDSVEILITKTMAIGESWEGVTRNTRLVVLKLDIHKAQTVHMIVEGKNAWANVQKSDRTEENLRKVQTDPATKRAIISWQAEQGSYLITIGPEEPNLMAKAKVTFLDTEAYAAWEEELEEEMEEKAEEKSAEEPAEEPVEEPVEEPIEEPAEETEEEPVEEKAEPEQEVQITEPEEILDEESQENITEIELNPERHITVEVTWDVPDPVIGDTAHFKAIMEGYEGLNYTMQWQYGPDKKTWYDMPGETGTTMDVVVTEENNIVYWRILVYIEEDQED